MKKNKKVVVKKSSIKNAGLGVRGIYNKRIRKNRRIHSKILTPKNTLH